MKKLKMTSLMMTKYGKINETLEFQEVSTPTISSNQILIKTKAASYNPLDYKIIRGDFKFIRKIQFPKGIGRDVSGTVEDIGADVKNFKIGDNVYSRINEDFVGTMAEYVVSNESDVSLIPSNLNFIESASIPLAGLTVYQSLIDIAKLSAGENILIYAGSGGVGSIAIQISKYLGANVTTTTSTNNVKMLKDLGADKVIDYTKQSFLDSDDKFDVVFDTLGGEHTLESFKVLKENGRVVSIAGDLDDVTAKQIGLNKIIRFILALKARKITKSALKIKASYRFYLMSPNGKQLKILAKLYEEGSIKPVIDNTYMFDESISAIDYLSNGHAKGKVVVEFPD